jgi:hypothetical protein
MLIQPLFENDSLKTLQKAEKKMQEILIHILFQVSPYFNLPLNKQAAQIISHAQRFYFPFHISSSSYPQTVSTPLYALNQILLTSPKSSVFRSTGTIQFLPPPSCIFLHTSLFLLLTALSSPPQCPLLTVLLCPTFKRWGTTDKA